MAIPGAYSITQKVQINQDAPVAIIGGFFSRECQDFFTNKISTKKFVNVLVSMFFKDVAVCSGCLARSSREVKVNRLSDL